MDLHPVKQETFDVSALTNVDPKGFTRVVERFVETDWGLYMARGADHPRFGYLESWLIPALSLRVNIFHFRPGVEQSQELYIDVADVTRDTRGDASVWRTRDLYVDIVTHADAAAEVLDLDELAAACAAGYLSATDTHRAMSATVTAIAGIARYGGDALAWLAEQGYELFWADAPALMPAGGSTSPSSPAET
ncbi:DUF402 domain-containing protein [Corynebacterium uterequi]|uniref:DUF402 domain-containing protein n=1 Tax=Corynebacterium uterequi TaxID=1072256 RepID=A0A0G3HFT1_9CORY|nr:DUF402 domain-containing protein [Corynebacterium uterequi]AKK10813.1 hypothetical protein CUTER_04035 [Corynebacterium uterequi]